MGKRLVCLAGMVSIAAGIAAAQSPGEYIDVFVVRVKQEKRPEFEATARRIADLNRRHGGDRWIAYSPLYGGEEGTVYFASRRDNLAAVGTAMEEFEKALAKGVGAANVPKLFAEFSSTVTSERGELRMRRQDLSFNLPDTLEGRTKIVAESRFLRTTMVRAKPGMIPGLTDIWTKIRSTLESQGATYPVAVFQAVTGPGGVFYFTSYARSLGDLDSQTMDLKKALGEEGYRDLQRQMSEVVADSRVEIYKLSPDISNPPEEFLAAAPAFWKPKPAMAATTTKPKAPTSASSQ